MKALNKHLGVASGNLRGGNEETMEQILGAKQGSVTIFGLVNDKDQKVKLILDQRCTTGEVE